jgi:predicted DNA-binding transcriptional regulator YafY
MPLHPSQKIVEESSEGIRIRFRAYISVELVNELMNYSDDVRVLKPIRLKKMLLKRAEQILKNNTET